MTASQNRQSSANSGRRERSETLKGPQRITRKQEKFLRKLLHVLSEIVDEKGHFDDEDVDPGQIDARVIDKGEDSEKGNINEAAVDTRKSVTDSKEPCAETKNIDRFFKLCEIHDQLTYQIRSSLSALGGGHRTAKALKDMQHGLNMARLSYDAGCHTILYPRECVQSLNTFRSAIPEVAEAIKELGVFNTRFFRTLYVLGDQTEHVLHILNSEYVSPGSGSMCFINEYLDYIFRPLVRDFEAFIHALTDVAEKGIATIRQTQDFSSQRYLILTTIATFLSSVSATTLQVTANASASVLSTITNSLWLISLVSSTASAVYSLLIMTWRQSAVRPPDLCLPSFAHTLLRNGPMFALIAALATFLIGLCCLAFLVADEQVVVSAVIPTAFAGFHAYIVSVFTAWFLFERWKTRYTESWMVVRQNWVSPVLNGARKVVDAFGYLGESMSKKFKMLSKLFSVKLFGIAEVVVSKKVHSDVENGGVRAMTRSPHLATGNVPSSDYGDENEEGNSLGAVEPVGTLAAPEAQSNVAELSAIYQLDHPTYDTNRLFDRKLQFSADCSILASAFKNFVVMYSVGESFDILTTIRVPDGSSIEQVAWEPNAIATSHHYPDEELYQNLLVRSTSDISVWYVYHRRCENQAKNLIRVDMLGQIKYTVGFARWALLVDTGFESPAFSCVINQSLKIFDRTCKELSSSDLSWIRHIDAILDAAFFRGKYILCLATIRDERYQTRLLIIEKHEKSVKRQINVPNGQNSLTISCISPTVLIHGSQEAIHRMEMTEYDMLDSSNKPQRLFDTIETPDSERSAVFCGNGDRLIIGYTKGNITIHLLTSTVFRNYYTIHIISSPTSRAVVQNPISIAVAPHPGGTFPYLFAFGDADGTVKIWSILSNITLLENESAELFEVNDIRERYRPFISRGRFVVLPPPENPQPTRPVEGECD